MLLVERHHARRLQRDLRHRSPVLPCEITHEGAETASLGRYDQPALRSITAQRLAIAVDASALARDRRGMGRLARGALLLFARELGIELTLLADGRDAQILRNQFPGVAVAPTGSSRRRGRYEVVWFPFNGMRYVPAAPTLVTMHDAFAFTEPHPERIARFREQTPMRRAARKAARIAVDSHWTCAEIERELRPVSRPVVVAPVPDAYFFPDAGGSLPPPPLDAVPYVLIVGVREPRKNARLALASCGQALRGDETLVVVGELTPADREFARRLRLRCGEVVAGDLTLRALYRRARLVLVPSLAEGFGLVAAEAMACGAPVIAARAAALPEVTGDAAELLDPQDVGQWVIAIRTLLDDAARRADLRARSVARFAHTDRHAFARAVLALLYGTAQARC